MRDTSRIAIVSSGDAETDRAEIDRFARHSDLIDAGMCPNGCGGMIADDSHNAHCPRCQFAYFSAGGMNFTPEGAA